MAAMSAADVILVLVVVTAISFDFTNGFHDTANAVATAIATGALKPRVAVLMSACLNLVGAFISIKVAATIAKGIVDANVLSGTTGLSLVFAALIGAVAWNLITWYFTIPSSSSHALIGGIIGATIVASGTGAVKFRPLVQTVLAPAIMSPVICALVAIIGTFCAYRLVRLLGEREAIRGYRAGQIGSAALVSLAHGTNDAQKTMGVISLALIANGNISSTHFAVPLWVKLACAVAIASGTAIGGWRIINTMGNRLTTVESPQGFSAESASASVILASSYFGYPLSTTHVVSGGVIGSGLGKRLASVHWGVAGQMATAWVFTIPAAGIMGAFAYGVSEVFGKGSVAGSLIIGIIAAAAASVLFRLAQRNNITAADLDRSHVTPEEEARRGAAALAAPAPVPAGAAG
jgi:PiT family inorganic phosphate transporter